MAGRSDLDLIVLPESCRGVGDEVAEPVDGPTVASLARIAQQAGAYLLVGLYLARESGNYVSAVLIDRAGSVVGVYDKRYPYWGELEITPQTRAGSAAPVWATDFGTLGAAICFDINFPRVWADLADAGVDLVVWPSAYAGGAILRSYAQIHHFHLLSCTAAGQSHLYDPVGAEIEPSAASRPSVREFGLDLDRGFYHHNFNLDRLDRLIAEHGADVRLEELLGDEEWFVLSRRDDGVEVDVRGLARQYGLEELRDYISRSRRAIDALRDASADAPGPGFEATRRSRTSTP